MGLLATWEQYSTYVDSNGKYRVIWQWEDGGIEFHKFDAFMDEAALAVAFENIKRDRDYGDMPKLQTVLDDNEALILEVVRYIRTHPALTLAQWNTVLATKTWYEQVVIRAFIYKLALLLAQHYGIELNGMTEATVLTKVRNWICTVNINILKKVVFGYFIEI